MPPLSTKMETCNDQHYCGKSEQNMRSIFRSKLVHRKSLSRCVLVILIAIFGHWSGTRTATARNRKFDRTKFNVGIKRYLPSRLEYLVVRSSESWRRRRRRPSPKKDSNQPCECLAFDPSHRPHTTPDASIETHLQHIIIVRSHKFVNQS
jgi:hypothetical protein